MGIHLGLTGLRGATMPILGWIANYYLQWGSFVISLSLALSSFVLFRRMALAERAAASLAAAAAVTPAVAPVGPAITSGSRPENPIKLV